MEPDGLPPMGSHRVGHDWGDLAAAAAYVPQLLYLFIYQETSKFLPCLAIVNNAAMNNGTHVSFSILVSSGYMPSSGIAGSYHGFIPRF